VRLMDSAMEDVRHHIKATVLLLAGSK